MERKKRVAILHPDLGIGGAEALIINLALALMSRGYEVTVYTPFYDPQRCLKESHLLRVVVKGNWFPRTIFGRLIALCAYIRMLLCSLWVVLFAGAQDWYVIDQVSLPIPLLRCRSRVFFYCHYPDKLLSVNRTNILMRFYRFWLDLIEEITTSLATVTVVNSKYTQGVYKESFKLIQKYCNNRTPDVLYPALDFSQFEQK